MMMAHFAHAEYHSFACLCTCLHPQQHEVAIECALATSITPSVCIRTTHLPASSCCNWDPFTATVLPAEQPDCPLYNAFDSARGMMSDDFTEQQDEDWKKPLSVLFNAFIMMQVSPAEEHALSAV
jgi:hypothetical protein